MNGSLKNVLIWGGCTPLLYVSLKHALIAAGSPIVPSMFVCAIIVAIAIKAKP